jgi:hypothetical protein
MPPKGTDVQSETRNTSQASFNRLGDITIDLQGHGTTPPGPLETTDETNSKATKVNGPPNGQITQPPVMGQQTAQTQQPEVEYIPPAGKELSYEITQVIETVQQTVGRYNLQYGASDPPKKG